jgi:two-component system, NtrC family, nitrogen regulation sensor histidine kinase NtrY
MNKRWIFTWLTVIFALFLALAIYAFHKGSPYLLIGSEIVIISFYAVTLLLITKIIKPVSIISRGVNLLREGDFNITMTKTGNGEIDNIIDVYNSMISHLREERLTVREKNQFLDLLIDSSPLGIILMDLDDKIMDINKAAIKCLGIENNDYTGKALAELNSRLANDTSKLGFDEKQFLIPDDGQKYLVRKLFFMDHGFRHPFYILEEFTEEIKKAERDTYRKLIRMMAHEVNNTIGSVNSIMSGIQSNPELFATSDRDEIVRILGIAIQRNYQMNRFMQNFSNVVKLPLPEKEKMDLNESIMVVIESFGPEMREKNILVTLNLNRSVSVINADRSQMEQVFTNIIRNSLEATPGSGHLIVTTTINPLTVIFEDNGTGLSKEAAEKLFTPFFSSKPGGQGIGLTLVNEILTNHGFPFVLRNKNEKGTIFTIKIEQELL